MRCLSCDQPIANLNEPCPHCQFQGDPALIEELSHVNWLMAQLDSLTTLGDAPRQVLQQTYAQRQRELEAQLGLRLPPFTQERALLAWPQLINRELLLERLGGWLAAGLTDPAATQPLVDETREQADELLEQLEGHARPDYPARDSERLEQTNFVLQAVDRLKQQRGFVSAKAEVQVHAPLLEAQAQLEIALGLRPSVTPAAAPAPEPQARLHYEGQAAPGPIRAGPAPVVPATPPEPRLPFRDRFWRTLLSERTLQAMLIMGIFLLFSAAISFVIWGWRDFSPPVRVAIPTAFMLTFLGLGWYVRNKTRMYRSGIALTAIAALLMPIDFYTVHVNFRIQPEYGPAFWLLTSIICLFAYIWITLRTQAVLFGYLVGTAAGSCVLALVAMGNRAFGLSFDWRSAALSALAMGLMLIAPFINRLPNDSRWRAMAEPCRNLALLTAGVLMPLSFGLRYIDRRTFDTLHYAMTVNWWLGGFIFAWGAINYRSRSLGILAAITLPVAMYMAQAVLFFHTATNPAWHGLGLALLVPLYFVVGHRLLSRKDDRVLYGHGRTATGWGVALLLVAALWSLTDLRSGQAAASSHTVLCGALVLAAILWQRPRLLYGASLFSVTSLTFVMSQANFSFAQFSIGWVSLAIAHVVIAIRVKNGYAGALVVAGYVVAAMACMPPLFPYDSGWLAYALGNWIALAIWGARLAHTEQAGFVAHVKLPGLRHTAFQWMAAVLLPLWLLVIFDHRGQMDFSFALALAALAWGMWALSYRLMRAAREYRRPWYLIGWLASLAAPIAAFILAPNGFTPSLCLLTIGLVYLADTVANRQSLEWSLAAVTTMWGLGLMLDKLRVPYDAVTLALALLIALYFEIGLWSERRRFFTHRFLRPLYITSHVLALFVLVRVYFQPLGQLLFHNNWTDEMRLWEAASQLGLAVVYALYAWNCYKERWGYIAAWLGAAGVGFIALSYSTGQGSLAAKGALGVIGYVLAERGLNWLRRRRATPRRARAFIRLAWWLYRRPLLVTGWFASVAVIGLALVRNLILLGGGRVQQVWAVVGLLMITGLYALSARMFRQSMFVWLAALLVIAPWTILTNLGFLLWPRPTTPGFAVSWMILAWLLYLIGVWLDRLMLKAYASPAQSVAHLLAPFSLLWGVANADASRFTFGLAIALYGLAAWRDHQRERASASTVSAWSTRCLYPALGLIPVWCVYLLAWLAPSAHHEHYGLMLILFGPLGLIAGRWLKQHAPRPESVNAYALPAYLTGYVFLVVGTLLVAHDKPLLALVLLYDAVLMVVSARVFKHPLWVYPATACVPLSLILAIGEAGVPIGRQGWWLIGLAAVYLLMAWALRRTRLNVYGHAPLMIGFALIALGLPPSSRDRVGAFWGYGSAATLYALTAFWLRQPLLLTPACASALMPYVVVLRQYIPPEYHGLALFPGAIVMLTFAWRLDQRRGAWRDFPWGDVARWGAALAERLLNWYALPVYALGLGMAAVTPLFSDFKPGLTALNWLLLMPIGGWAIYRFRLRVWLLATAAAGHLAAIYYLQSLGWWRYPEYAWTRFLPAMLIAAALAIWVERRRGEGSPLSFARALRGWSRPLYVLVLFDVLAGQTLGSRMNEAGALITLTNALLIGVLASFWSSGWMPYLAAALGVLALLEWLATLTGPIESLPVALAYLDLGYGLIGYGLSLLRVRRNRNLPAWLSVWASPLQRFSLLYSSTILIITAILGPSLIVWTVRAMFGLPFRELVELPKAQMIVSVFSLLGLLYIAAALFHRRLRAGYVAVAMLIAAWMFHAFYVQQWDGASQVQWYALPAGLYLLGVGFLEAQRGNRGLARWLDYAAMLLMMGSLFWQTLLLGWRYALMLGAEGFGAFWWGSARRLRRFLYAGMMGVILATVAQLINSLRSVNQWIIFGLIGLMVVITAIVVERKLEDIKAWRQILETWE